MDKINFISNYKAYDLMFVILDYIHKYNGNSGSYYFYLVLTNSKCELCWL